MTTLQDLCYGNIKPNEDNILTDKKQQATSNQLLKKKFIYDKIKRVKQLPTKTVLHRFCFFRYNGNIKGKEHKYEQY